MLALLAVALAPALAPAAPAAPAQGPLPGNIVEVAEANGNFTTLVTALQITGLDAAPRRVSRPHPPHRLRAHGRGVQ